MKQGYNPKTGARIIGTYETMPCTYGISGFEDDGTHVADDTYKDFWEGVEQVVRDGSPVYLDENGDEVLLRDIIFKDQS